MGGALQIQADKAKKELSEEQIATLLSQHVTLSILQAAVAKAKFPTTTEQKRFLPICLPKGLCTFKGYLNSAWKKEEHVDMSCVPHTAHPACTAPLEVPYFSQDMGGMCGPTGWSI